MTTGAGKTGLTNASFTWYYWRDGDSAATSITTGAGTLGTWSSGGIKEMDATNMPGWYEIGVPNAVLASGANDAVMMLKGTNLVPVNIEVQLSNIDQNDAVRAGLTALPNAAAEASGGLYTRGTGAGQINQDANGRVDANVKTWIGGTIPAVNVTGVPIVDDKYLLGTIYATPATAGIQDVNAKNWNNLATVDLPLAPTTAGRKLDVTATGEAGIDLDNTAGTLSAAEIPNLDAAISTRASASALTTAQSDLDDIQTRLPASLTANGNIKASLVEILTTALTETAGLLAGGFKKFFNVSTPTGTINSIPDAVAGAAGGLAIVGSNVGVATSVSGAVGSVTGNIGGNVVGSVASVTADVGITQAGADKVWSTTVRAITDKADFALSAAGVQAIWDALTSALTTVGSIGKWIVDKLDVVVSTRLASASYSAPLDAAGVRSAVGLASANLDTQLSTIDDFIDTEVGAIKTKTDQLTFTVANQVDTNVVDWKGATAPAMTGDAFARLGAPAGASVSADVAAVKVDTAAIKAKTDNLPSDPADASDFTSSFSTVNGTLSTIAGYIDTEVAAIKAKTDNLPASPAATGDIPTTASIVDAVWDEDIVAAHTTADTAGKKLSQALILYEGS